MPAASPWLLLAGPTAVGKSAVALHLAERLNGEILSVDSMQVYRGLDIGTAKPGADDRRRVPHHLLDVVEVGAPFDAAQFAARTQVAVQDIEARGRLPILCGGTGLYFRAFLEGLGQAPPSDPRVRAELENTPLPRLLEELAVRDPALHAVIDQANPRRVVRALEVIRLTGAPFSAQRAAWRGTDTGSHPIFTLTRAAADLRARIEARVNAMFARGLVAETEGLLRAGLEQNRTAMQALGYRQVVEHLRGERSLPETVALVKVRTWHYARRQLTWFRRQPGVEWLEIAPDESPASVARRVEECWRLQREQAR